MGVSAFSAYASTGAHGFTTSARKRAGSSSPALGENETEASTSASVVPNGDEEASKEGSDSEKDKEVSFGERLRSQKDDEGASDDEKKLNLTEQEGWYLFKDRLWWQLISFCRSSNRRGR